MIVQSEQYKYYNNNQGPFTPLLLTFNKYLSSDKKHS